MYLAPLHFLTYNQCQYLGKLRHVRTGTLFNISNVDLFDFATKPEWCAIVVIQRYG